MVKLLPLRFVSNDKDLCQQNQLNICLYQFYLVYFFNNLNLCNTSRMNRNQIRQKVLIYSANYPEQKEKHCHDYQLGMHSI